MKPLTVQQAQNAEMLAELRAIRCALLGLRLGSQHGDWRPCSYCNPRDDSATMLEALEAIRSDPEFGESGSMTITKGQKRLVGKALAAYDAHKEPAGNHAESSATRGDRLDVAEAFIRRMGMEYRYQEFITTRGDTNE